MDILQWTVILWLCTLVVYVVCLVILIGKSGVDTPLYDFVHHIDLVDLSSAFSLWMLNSGNEIRGAYRCSRLNSWTIGLTALRCTISMSDLCFI